MEVYIRKTTTLSFYHRIQVVCSIVYYSVVKTSNVYPVAFCSTPGHEPLVRVQSLKEATSVRKSDRLVLLQRVLNNTDAHTYSCVVFKLLQAQKCGCGSPSVHEAAETNCVRAASKRAISRKH